MATNSTGYSCLMQGKFDFRTTSGTGKWSTQQETYRLNALRLSNAGSEDAYPFEVLETKLKVRGRGKALILRWESSTGKDFELLGWSIPIEVETQE